MYCLLFADILLLFWPQLVNWTDYIFQEYRLLSGLCIYTHTSECYQRNLQIYQTL